MISDADGELLLRVARRAIGEPLGKANGQPPLERGSSALHENLCSFVTLHLHGELRGCVGRLQPVGSLIEDVAHNARAAAFSDPRFAPLQPAELSLTVISVSILGPASPLQFDSERSLLQQLRFGEGVILREGEHQATFLPDVWPMLPEPERFWRALKRKAGLADSYWSSTLEVERYRTWQYCEPEHAGRN